MFLEGTGVGQDHTEAAKWYNRAAAQGHAIAQYTLGVLYAGGTGVGQDYREAVKWCQLAAVQDDQDALENLGKLQKLLCIPAPPAGTNVRTVLLTSAAGRRCNNALGKVVAPSKGDAVTAGRVAVLLDGGAKPKAFKLMNLYII